MSGAIDRKMDTEPKKQRGRASLLFEEPPLVLACASVVGKKE